jgi:hypothetical protein
LSGNVTEVIYISVHVVFAVVGAGVVEICNVSNLSHVEFAPDGFKAECCMRGVIALEGDGFGRLYWDSGSFRSRCRVGRESSIGAILQLQAAAAAIVWDSLAIPLER